jgi:hypothetical protein
VLRRQPFVVSLILQAYKNNSHPNCEMDLIAAAQLATATEGGPARRSLARRRVQAEASVRQKK